MIASDVTQPTVVLVHGAWADGSSWRSVIALLQRNKIPVVATQNPTSSLADDVASVHRVLDEIDGTVVLVGHSWGGTVITQAGNDPKVKGLVFVAAFAPEIGQSSIDLITQFPSPPALGEIKPNKSGGLVMSPHGWHNYVAQDIPESDVRLLVAVAPPLGGDAFSEKVTIASWSTRPAWYIVSTDDLALNVELQRAIGSKMNARTTLVKASHMSLLSAPQAVADVIESAVESVRGSSTTPA